MAQAKHGDRVRFHFEGRLDDGTVFDTTHETDECEDECGCEAGPMELVIGDEAFFPQVEEALVGMAPGEKKTIVILSDDAFGDYDDEQVFTVGREQFPDDLNPQVGDDLEMTDDDGEAAVVTVIEVGNGEVTLDANHPLAGEDLTFDLELVEIL